MLRGRVGGTPSSHAPRASTAWQPCRSPHPVRHRRCRTRAPRDRCRSLASKHIADVQKSPRTSNNTSSSSHRLDENVEASGQDLPNFEQGEEEQAMQGSVEIFLLTCSLSLCFDVWCAQRGHRLDSQYLIAALLGSLASGVAAAQVRPPKPPGYAKLVGRQSRLSQWPGQMSSSRDEHSTFNSSNGGRNSRAIDMSKVQVRRTFARIGQLPRHKYTITHNDFTGVIQLQVRLYHRVHVLLWK